MLRPGVVVILVVGVEGVVVGLLRLELRVLLAHMLLPLGFEATLVLRFLGSRSGQFDERPSAR
jgi:hypothetical protein